MEVANFRTLIKKNIKVTKNDSFYSYHSYFIYMIFLSSMSVDKKKNRKLSQKTCYHPNPKIIKKYIYI